jgi:hypothetical protein
VPITATGRPAMVTDSTDEARNTFDGRLRSPAASTVTTR